MPLAFKGKGKEPAAAEAPKKTNTQTSTSKRKFEIAKPDNAMWGLRCTDIPNDRVQRALIVVVDTEESYLVEQVKALNIDKFSLDYVCIVTETDFLQAVRNIVDASNRAVSTFILTQRISYALDVLKCSHIPVAALTPKTPFPVDDNELAVWRMQAVTWTHLKEHCICQNIPFFVAGDPGQGFAAIAETMRHAKEDAATQLFVYMLPFAMTILPPESKNSFTSTCSTMLGKWGWHETPRKITGLSEDPNEILRIFSCRDQSPIVAKSLVESQFNSSSALCNVFKNAFMNILLELIYLDGDFEEVLKIEANIAYDEVKKETIPGNPNPTWAHATQFIIDKCIAAQPTDGSKRVYDTNCIASMYTGQLLLLMYTLMRFHDPQFDPEHTRRACNRTVPEDFATVVENHMDRLWMLRCITPPKVKAECERKKIDVPPGLRDMRCAATAGDVSDGEEEEEETKGRKNRVVDLEAGASADEHENSDDSDSDFNESDASSVRADDHIIEGADEGSEHDSDVEFGSECASEDIDSLGGSDAEEETDAKAITKKLVKISGKSKKTESQTKKKTVPKKMVSVSVGKKTKPTKASISKKRREESDDESDGVSIHSDNEVADEKEEEFEEIKDLIVPDGTGAKEEAEAKARDDEGDAVMEEATAEEEEEEEEEEDKEEEVKPAPKKRKAPEAESKPEVKKAAAKKVSAKKPVEKKQETNSAAAGGLKKSVSGLLSAGAAFGSKKIKLFAFGKK